MGEDSLVKLKEMLWYLALLWNVGMIFFVRSLASYHPKAHCKKFILVENTILAKILISSNIRVFDQYKELYGECEVEDRKKCHI